MKKLEEFFFRYFSYSTLNNDKDNWLRYVVALALLSPALIGIVFDVLGMVKPAKAMAFIFLGVFIAFAGLWITVWIYHNIKTKKK